MIQTAGGKRTEAKVVAGGTEGGVREGGREGASNRDGAAGGSRSKSSTLTTTSTYIIRPGRAGGGQSVSDQWSLFRDPTGPQFLPPTRTL